MATVTPRMLFVNIAVDDLARSVAFFNELGFTFDPRFTDEQATCMILSDQAYVMLLVKDRFKDFTRKQLADPQVQTEAILALSAASRRGRQPRRRRGAGRGGLRRVRPDGVRLHVRPQLFHDPDGHIWEVMWMDPAHVDSL